MQAAATTVAASAGSTPASTAGPASNPKRGGQNQGSKPAQAALSKGVCQMQAPAMASSMASGEGVGADTAKTGNATAGHQRVRG